MPSVLIVQHAAFEPPGTVADALRAHGIDTRIVRPFEGDSVPKHPGRHTGLLLLGGPQSVYQHNEYAWIADEIALIENALRHDVPVLGICLGSQLLAAALGAEVRKGKRPEIGWHPVTLTPAAADDALWRSAPKEFMAYHWHGDVFDLPEGAVSLASSRLTPHQAFRYRRIAYGILFHMEVTSAIIGGMVTNATGELHNAGVDAQKIINGARDHLSVLQAIGATVFMRWAQLVKAPR